MKPFVKGHSSLLPSARRGFHRIASNALQSEGIERCKSSVSGYSFIVLRLLSSIMLCCSCLLPFFSTIVSLSFSLFPLDCVAAGYIAFFLCGKEGNVTCCIASSGLRCCYSKTHYLTVKMSLLEETPTPSCCRSEIKVCQ